MGNYESCKIDVWVALPSDPNGIAIEEAYLKAKEFCEAKIEEAVKQVKNT